MPFGTQLNSQNAAIHEPGAARGQIRLLNSPPRFCSIQAFPSARAWPRKSFVAASGDADSAHDKDAKAADLTY